jgi:hypothetical protein
VTMLETAARPSAAVIARARMWPVLPLMGLGFAVVVNGVWIAFLSYWLLRLI